MRYLLIDCQILQTDAFDRGMGKYTLSLLKELVEENKSKGRYDKIQILLSKNLDITTERLAVIDSFLPGLEKAIIDLPTDIDNDIEQKYLDAREKLNEHIKKTYSNQEQVTFLITSPFFVKFPAVFPDSSLTTNIAIIYDLIPYKIWHLQRIFPDEIYMKHYGLMIEADELFTISNAVKDDLNQLVGIPEEKMTSIDGAAFEREGSKADSLSDKFVEPFILMPSGPIIHKNNERAVKGFEQFNKKQGGKYTLVITSSFDDATKEKLSALSNRVVFSGNISDAELALAYDKASCVLFPSLSEGLGMPILEAVRFEVPIACSDIPVLTELSSTGFYQFDPIDISTIANALENACTKKNWEDHKADYPRINAKYTWKRSAQVLLENAPRENEDKGPEKPVLNIEVVDPRDGSPAGRLGEQLFAQLSADFDARIQCTPANTTKMPAYVPFMQRSFIQDAKTLRLKNKNSIFGKKKVVIQLTGTNNIVLYATRTVLDRSLSIESWAYLDENNNTMTTRQIYERIHDQFVRGQ